MEGRKKVLRFNPRKQQKIENQIVKFDKGDLSEAQLLKSLVTPEDRAIFKALTLMDPSIKDLRAARRTAIARSLASSDRVEALTAVRLAQKEEDLEDKILGRDGRTNKIPDVAAKLMEGEEIEDAEFEDCTDEDE